MSRTPCTDFPWLSPSELHLDVVYSSSTTSVYSRTASYATQFVASAQAISLSSSRFDASQPQLPLSLSSPLLSRRMDVLPSLVVRSFKQEFGGKTLRFSAILSASLDVTFLLVAPRWILPPNLHIARMNVKSSESSSFSFNIVRSALVNLSRLSVNGSALADCIDLWSSLSERGDRSKEERELFVVQICSVSKGASIHVELDMLRVLQTEGIRLSEAFKAVFAFWSCERGKRSGYLPLAQLVSPRLLQNEALLPTSAGQRRVEVSVRDASKGELRFSLKGALRMYPTKAGSKVDVVYRLSRSETDSVHQV